MSRFSRQFFDPVRKRLVAATPEEKVRQGLLRRMIADLGFPKGLIAVEPEIKDAFRRADLMCYYLSEKAGGVVKPLLLVECKAGRISRAACEQALGYNAEMRAPFFCLAGGKEICTMWFNGAAFDSVPFLPVYAELSRMAERFS